jgi:nucleotide-binding universal stress UspA family protein
LLAHLEDERGIRCRGRLESGDPVSAILQVAEEEHYDLIVMGTRGRTGMSHLWHGSKTWSVVRRASCPVLTVRAPEAEKRPAKAHKEPFQGRKEEPKGGEQWGG